MVTMVGGIGRRRRKRSGKGMASWSKVSQRENGHSCCCCFVCVCVCEKVYFFERNVAVAFNAFIFQQLFFFGSVRFSYFEKR